MNKPLHYYLTGSAADRLADEYGEFLEHMTKDQKLLMLSILSGVLYYMEINPCEEYSIDEHIQAQPAPIKESIGDAFYGTMTQLDECESSWIAMLAMVLAVAVTEQR